MQAQTLFNSIYKKIDGMDNHPKLTAAKKCAAIQCCLITLEALKAETKKKRKYDNMKLEIAKMK